MTDADIRDALRTVTDPEVGINIVDLGLVYGVEVDGARVHVVMTMTSPMCPLRDYIQDLVESAITAQVTGVERVTVDIVTEPPWTPDMMSEAARAQLG